MNFKLFVLALVFSSRILIAENLTPSASSQAASGDSAGSTKAASTLKQQLYFMMAHYAFNSVITGRFFPTWLGGVDAFSQIPVPKSSAKLYLGMIPSPSVYAMLPEKESIKFISVVEDFEIDYMDAATATRRVQFASIDHKGLTVTLLDQGADKLHQLLANGESVYVHCKSGVGRSASLVAAYLIKYHNLSREEAGELIQNNRRQVVINNPREDHYLKLQEYESYIERTKSIAGAPVTAAPATAD